MESTMSPSKFNMTAIVTAKDTITDDELKHFLLDNLSTFDRGSKFTIFCGHHHSGPNDEKPTLENVHLAESDPILTYNHHMVYTYYICIIMYNFYPIFHCSLYCKAVYNAEQLIFYDFFFI